MLESFSLEEKAQGRIRVVHVPKTIDNDLDLPAYVDTFGYQTARHIGVEPETALQGTNTVFKRRFQAMEARARQMGRDFREMSLAEQDALWDEVKRAESRF